MSVVRRLRLRIVFAQGAVALHDGKVASHKKGRHSLQKQSRQANLDQGSSVTRKREGSKLSARVA